MLKKTFYSIICIMFVLILSNVVSAQARPAILTVTPYFGGYLFDKDQKLSNAPVYGIRLGYNFTKYFGVEASGEYIATKYDLLVSDSRSTNVGNYRFDGILNLIPDSRLVPFVFAGFGGQSIDYPKNVPNKSAYAVDYGAGLKFFITDWFALRADIRQIYIFDNSKKDIEYTLGLTFSFGGSKPASVSSYEPIAKLAHEPIVKEKVEEKVVIMAAEPEVEQKVMAKAEPKKVTFSADSSADSLFDFDKSTVKPAGKKALDKFAADLRGTNFDVITVTGYTDRIGSHAYNMKLSTRRAEAVKAYLVESAGIPAGKITTKGVDGANPVTKPGECKGKKATKKLIACLGPDRRVEVEVVATRTSK